MSAHCNDCGADLVYGKGEDWQVMTCPVCRLSAENQRLRDTLEVIADNYAHCLPGCIEGPPTCGCDMRRARAALDGSPGAENPEAEQTTRGAEAS